MENIYNYIEKYGNCSFKEKKFNEIDNILFSSLSYLNFNDNYEINTLEFIGKDYLSKNKYRDVSKMGIAQKEAYKLLETVITKDRYKNILLTDYVYKVGRDIQFSAVTFNISKKLKYISFEGTDELISGWKEDAWMSCKFPILSQIEAIKYVNKHIKFLGPDVIIGGHSKGGNLALVSCMFLNKWKFLKVKKIYNNDGPGLRPNEFYTKKYRKVRKKLIHLVPNYSIIGVLLKNDKYKVVKSNRKNIMAHSILTWQVEDDHFTLTELSEKSKNLEARILDWTERHSDKEKEKMINALFSAVEKCNIVKTNDMYSLKTIISLIKEINQIDIETKKLMIELLNYGFFSKKSINN